MKEEMNSMKNNAFIENVSPVDFETTVDRLLNETDKKTWKVINVYDLQKTMEKHGKTVLPVKVFSLCHPKYAGSILEKSSERIVSPMMPCRVSVYEKDDGKTYISRMNSLILASSFGGIVEDVMTSSAKEVEEIIDKILH